MMRNRLLNVFDALLVALAMWFVVPPALLDRILEFPLPGGNRIASNLSLRNLTVFVVLVLIRFALAGRASSPSWPSVLAAKVRPGWRPVVIGICCFVIFLGAAHRGMWPSGDTIPSRLVPISILEEGNLDLDEFVDGIPHAFAYGLYFRGGHAYSAYPPGTAFTALPVYAAYWVLFPGSHGEAGGEDQMRVAVRLERISAALIGALCAALFWLIALRGTKSARTALMFTVAFALGTSLASTAAIGLWQHGPGCLFVLLTVWSLMKAEARPVGWLICAGLCGAWAYWCRPTTLFITAVLAVCVLKEHRFRALYFLVPCALGGVGAVALNQVMFGRLTGGYAGNMSLFVPFDGRVFVTHLFSPSRGLFFFSPFLLFGLVAGIRRLRRVPFDLASFCLYAALGQALLFSCWRTWAAGSSFGPRYLCEAALLLCVAMCFSFSRIRWGSWKGIVFTLAVIFCCYLHLLGGSQGDRGWTVEAFKPDDLGNAWNVRDSQVAWTLGLDR